MQAGPYESNSQDPGMEETVVLVSHTMDKLALIWSIGIGIGYAFLVSFICWIGYRCFLIYNVEPYRRFSIHRYRTQDRSAYQRRLFWSRTNPP